MTYQYDLSGVWNFRLDNEKKGMDAHYETGAFSDTIRLPGTTSEQKKGAPNQAAETGSLTVAYLTEGYAWYQRELTIAPDAVGQHAILKLERTRISHVWVDGVYVGGQNSLCTSHCYDLTAFIKQAHPVLTIMTSNVDYPTRGGHMTSPDTQTNWNGIVGSMTLTFYDTMRIRLVRIDTDYEKRVLTGMVSIDNYSKCYHSNLIIKALSVTLEHLSIPHCQSDACGLTTLLPAEQVLADSSAVTLFEDAVEIPSHSGTYTCDGSVTISACEESSQDAPSISASGQTVLRFQVTVPESLSVWDEPAGSGAGLSASERGLTK